MAGVESVRAAFDPEKRAKLRVVGVWRLARHRYGWLFYWTAHLGIGGLHVTTNLNHYHMPMTHDVCTPANGGWLKHQLLTTSNIAGSTFLDWWAGGLQLQVGTIAPSKPTRSSRQTSVCGAARLWMRLGGALFAARGGDAIRIRGSLQSLWSAFSRSERQPLLLSRHLELHAPE
jgi:hypothetical protein